MISKGTRYSYLCVQLNEELIVISFLKWNIERNLYCTYQPSRWRSIIIPPKRYLNFPDPLLCFFSFLMFFWVCIIIFLWCNDFILVLGHDSCNYFRILVLGFHFIGLLLLLLLCLVAEERWESKRKKWNFLGCLISIMCVCSVVFSVVNRGVLFHCFLHMVETVSIGSIMVWV